MGFSPVCNNFPFGCLGKNLESEWCPNAWLVETGEKSVAKERLQVRENVHFVILGIFVVVQTSTVSDVGVPKMESHCVLFINRQVAFW